MYAYVPATEKSIKVRWALPTNSLFFNLSENHISFHYVGISIEISRVVGTKNTLQILMTFFCVYLLWKYSFFPCNSSSPLPFSVAQS
jgi:hypothetical protein